MKRFLAFLAWRFPSAPKSVPPTPWLPTQREPDAWQQVCRSAMRQAQISEEVRRSADLLTPGWLFMHFATWERDHLKDQTPPIGCRND